MLDLFGKVIFLNLSTIRSLMSGFIWSAEPYLRQRGHREVVVSDRRHHGQVYRGLCQERDPALAVPHRHQADAHHGVDLQHFHGDLQADLVLSLMSAGATSVMFMFMVVSMFIDISPSYSRSMSTRNSNGSLFCSRKALNFNGFLSIWN